MRDFGTSYNLGSMLSYFCAYYCRRFYREMRGQSRDEGIEQELYPNIPTHMLHAFRWHGSVDTKHPLYREVPPSQRLKIDDQLVDTLLPLAKWCIYSKVPPVKFSGVLALSCLSKLWPRKVLAFALPEIHDCLTALSQSHRLLIGVEIFSAVHVALLHPHLGLEFSSHLPQLLQAIIFGIDASLTDQTIQTLALLSRIFAKVPFLTN
ncbi:hypothetical protein RFI_24859, partial [Reticulomyxa filosa]